MFGWVLYGRSPTDLTTLSGNPVIEISNLMPAGDRLVTQQSTPQDSPLASDITSSTIPITTSSPNVDSSTIPSESKPSMIYADHTGYCTADIEEMTIEGNRLAGLLASKILDEDYTTCSECFEADKSLLQITLRVLRSDALLGVHLVGTDSHCRQPFSVVYIDAAPAAVAMKKQCVLREETMIDASNNRVQCVFNCISDFCVQQDMNLTLTFQRLQWHSENQANAKLCEVMFSSVD